MIQWKNNKKGAIYIYICIGNYKNHVVNVETLYKILISWRDINLVMICTKYKNHDTDANIKEFEIYKETQYKTE